jgi:hypothetical protein
LARREGIFVDLPPGFVTAQFFGVHALDGNHASKFVDVCCCFSRFSWPFCLLTSNADTFPALFVRSQSGRSAASGAVSLEMRGREIQLGWVGLERRATSHHDSAG